MCGIAGFTGPGNRILLQRMTRSLLHRGPDEEGFYTDSSVNLGIRRLSIVDIDTGNQPLCNEDENLWVVFNGEIYNHHELRADLEKRGHRFRTDHADTEIILHLFEEMGLDWPLSTNGMFAVALWDKMQNRLLLYRDRIGKKPLYYGHKNGQLIFGSEIKSLLQHPSVSRDLNFRALYNYFSLKNISAPETAFADIQQLLPGHFLIWKNGSISTHAYWTLNFTPSCEGISEEDTQNELLALFEDAVRIRMDCDAPFGAYLSGGLDSSSVVAVMSKAHPLPIKTFCLGYNERPEGQFAGKDQDIQFARAISRRLGTEHHEYYIDAQQFADLMPEAIAAFDEPFSGVVSTYFLSMYIKEHVKVALSGDGADELFGSYLSHRLAFPIENFRQLTRKGILSWDDLDVKQRASLAPFDRPQDFSFLRSISSERISGWRSKLNVFSGEEKKRLFNRDFFDAYSPHSNEDIYSILETNLTAQDILNRSLEIDQIELLPNQVLPFVDRLSMAHSIEVRVPYLDYRIIEFVNSLPGRLKIKRGIVKYIHKKTMQHILPPDLVHRPKEGFVQPIYSWMHTKLQSWVVETLHLLPTELFNMQYIDEIEEKFKKGDHSLDAKIWNLVCFAIWFRRMSAL